MPRKVTLSSANEDQRADESPTALANASQSEVRHSAGDLAAVGGGACQRADRRAPRRSSRWP